MTSTGAPLRIAVMLSRSSEAGNVGLEQFLGVYYALQDAGAEVLVASMCGGYPWPTRFTRLGAEADELARRFQADRRARDDLANTLRFGELFEEDFHGGFCVGEPGALWRDADRNSAAALIAQFLQAGKPIAVLPSLLDILPKGAGDGLLILGDGAWPPSAAVAALLAAATRQFEIRRLGHET
ncbi:MAG: transporter [Mesorhizobium sp.]|uniref:transporter n=1 Tax=Mesorhizobium sp. TaxID=1871066 RepID=UPI000FE786C9|nr:transporter [Mesorhizobium sp.]RWN57806.1 MAG: transporter [Mesorhizobium sp.]TIN07711.1 MAG: transporter [Mesorhizobium sp.]TIN40430.1 MAG: transporter [Mesorhizobium sp.]TIN75685.1 MAG: transporter [Mesorhizobium sp.]TJU83816.1 MAG: transporter [Mesorhizobium sp.]